MNRDGQPLEPLRAEVDRLRRRVAELEGELCQSRREEERLHWMVESTPEGVVLVDAEGRIVLVNARAETLFGYPRTEMLGEPVEMLVPNVMQGSHADCRSADASDPGDRTLVAEDAPRGRRKDGSEFPVKIGRTPIRTAESPLVRVAICDITERNEAEQVPARKTDEPGHARDLSQQRATLLQAILDSIGEGLAVADETGQFLQWNPAAERILGLGALDVPPERWTEEYGIYHLDQTTPYPPEDLPLARAIRGEDVDNVELFVRHAALPEGAWVIVTGRPLRDVSGKLRGGVVIFRDVSDVKRGREEVAQLAALVEASDDAIIGEALDGTITSWNAGAARLFGYSPEEVTGRPVSVLVPPGRIDDLSVISERIRRGERVERYETVRRRKDGRDIVVSLTVSPLYNAAGTPIGACKVARDITEQKRIDELLREREEQFRTTFEQAAVGVAHVGLDGKWLRVNRRLCAIVGYSEEELVRKTLDDITHADDVASDLEYVRQVLAGEIETYSSEKRYVRKGGIAVWINLTVSLARQESGEPKYFIAVVEDISERKNTTLALQQSVARFALAQQAASIGAFEWDIGSNRVQWTPELEALYGLPPGGFGGQYESWAAALHPEDAAEAERQVRRAIDGNQDFNTEFRIVRPDGGERWIEALARVQRDAAGSPVRMVGINMDVSRRRQAEADLRESERRYRFLADVMPQIVWTARPDGALDYYNQRWYDYTGMTFEQTRDWGWQPVLHPDDLRNCLDRWTRAVRTGGDYEIEYRFKRASDGAYRWHLGRAFPRRNPQGEIVQWVGTCTDIHDQKRTEEDLRLSEERFRRALVDAPFPILLHAEDGEVLQVSDAWIEATGYRREELSTIADWTERAYGVRKAAVRADIDRLYGLDHRLHEGEYVIRTSAGEVRVWDFSSAPLGSLPDGRRLAISMAMDVTERKHAEDQVRQLNAELEQRVRLRTAELEDSRNRFRTMFEEAPLVDCT